MKSKVRRAIVVSITDAELVEGFPVPLGVGLTPVEAMHSCSICLIGFSPGLALVKGQSEGKHSVSLSASPLQ